MYWGYDSTIILLVPAIILTVIAQGKVKSAYRRYSGVRNARGITGAQAAERILRANGLTDVRIEHISGELTDHYDPRGKVLRLSDGVYDTPSVAAVGIAAHEVGHAIQHAHSYMPLKFRNAIVPVVNISSKLAWPIIILGIILVNMGRGDNGTLVLNIGIILFAAIVLFHAVTLPVEFNASRRALKQVEELGIVSSEEKRGVKKVLSAAAMTYMAALAAAVANLLRIIIIARRD